jgi:hypothetical protein
MSLLQKQDPAEADNRAMTSCPTCQGDPTGKAAESCSKVMTSRPQRQNRKVLGRVRAYPDKIAPDLSQQATQPVGLTARLQRLLRFPTCIKDRRQIARPPGIGVGEPDTDADAWSIAKYASALDKTGIPSGQGRHHEILHGKAD